MKKECLHKHLFHRMVYPMKQKVSDTQDIQELDMSKPEIETICADCGLWIKSIKVKRYLEED